MKPLDHPWIEDSDYRGSASYRALGPKEREMADFYHSNGYLVLERLPILEGVLPKRLDRHVEKHFEWQAGRLRDGWAACEDIRRIAVFEPVLEILRMLYGREPHPFQTLNFINGTEQRTHSDAIHFSCEPARFMCGVWVALEDITVRQGPLHYYVGSQRLPEFNYVDLKIGSLDGHPDWSNPEAGERYRRYEDSIENLAREHAFRRDELAVASGTILIWSSNLFHGGSLIGERGRTRKSQVTHYFFDDCLYSTPMFSQPDRGLYYLRAPLDIRTGDQVRLSRNGQPVVCRPDGARFEILDAPPGLSYSEELAKTYLARYPDIRSSPFGGPSGAWNHFVLYGSSEGRIWG